MAEYLDCSVPSRAMKGSASALTSDARENTSASRRGGARVSHTWQYWAHDLGDHTLADRGYTVDGLVERYPGEGRQGLAKSVDFERSLGTLAVAA